MNTKPWLKKHDDIILRLYDGTEESIDDCWYQIIGHTRDAVRLRANWLLGRGERELLEQLPF